MFEQKTYKKLNQQGHFLILKSDTEYELKESLLEMHLTLDDFENYGERKWKSMFRQFKKRRLQTQDIVDMMNFLPKVVYMRLKDSGALKRLKENEVLSLAGIQFYPKSKSFKKDTISLFFDRLCPVKKNRWFLWRS